MDLFNNTMGNLLPYDGTVLYYGRLMSNAEADRYFDLLMHEIAWQHDEAIIFGRHITTARKVAWYGDVAYAYTYSKTTKYALPWTDTLNALRQTAEQVTGTVYNSCLLNLYHDGNEGMAWHSDDEKTLGKHSSIASMSFGAERSFAFRHKTSKTQLRILLEHGSLLLMAGSTQTHWLHQLPKSARIKRPRINLTFRNMTPPTSLISGG